MKPGFDRLAATYQALEFLAFGSDLERTRFCLLARLADCRSILVLGEGDGRCLARLAQLAPHAHIHCIDLSAGMIARAARRVGPQAPARLRLEQADALRLPLAAGAYDAVVTLFFLDCLTAAQVEALVLRVGAACVPRALWLFADFVLPPAGWRRMRARGWIGLLYLFFRWQTDLAARNLPPSERVLRQNGWTEVESRGFQAGMLRAAIFQRGGDSPAP